MKFISVPAKISYFHIFIFLNLLYPDFFVSFCLILAEQGMNVNVFLILFIYADGILGYKNPYDAILRHCKNKGIVFHAEVINSAFEHLKKTNAFKRFLNIKILNFFIFLTGF